MCHLLPGTDPVRGGIPPPAGEYVQAARAYAASPACDCLAYAGKDSRLSPERQII